MKALAELMRPGMDRQPVYVPGRPIAELAAELGLAPEAIAKLASNENPLGPSPQAVAAGQATLAESHLYPENDAPELRTALAERFALAPDQFVFGAGSVQVIEMLAHAFLGPGRSVVVGAESFIAYKLCGLLMGAEVIEVPMPEHRHDLAAMAEAIREDTRLVFLPSPSNPTGTENDPAEIIAFAEGLPDQVILCFDEAYAEYLGDDRADLRPLIAQGRHILCTRTFSKLYALAGLRIGYGYGPPDLVALLNRVRPPFNTSSVAQAMAQAALQDQDFLDRSRAVNSAGLAQLGEGLHALDIDFVPSRANFLMVDFGENAQAIHDALRAAGIIVRPLAPYGLGRYLRISVGTEAQNTKLLDRLAAEVASSSP